MVDQLDVDVVDWHAVGEQHLFEVAVRQELNDAGAFADAGNFGVVELRTFVEVGSMK